MKKIIALFIICSSVQLTASDNAQGSHENIRADRPSTLATLVTPVVSTDHVTSIPMPELSLDTPASHETPSTPVSSVLPPLVPSPLLGSSTSHAQLRSPRMASSASQAVLTALDRKMSIPVSTEKVFELSHSLTQKAQEKK